MASKFERRLHVAALAVLVFLGFAAQASPQTPRTPAGNTWSRGTTLEVFAGTARVPPNVATSTFGSAVGWELNHVAEIEGVAAWLPERHGAQSFAADLKLLVNLTPPARVVPFLAGGAGLYREAFDETRATIPAFYQRRMAGFSTRGTFTDPTIVIAGGVNVFTARHFSARPEIGLRLVTRGGRAYKVTTFTCALIYHVEDHPLVK